MTHSDIEDLEESEISSNEEARRKRIPERKNKITREEEKKERKRPKEVDPWDTTKLNDVIIETIKKMIEGP